jgi:DNA-binding MarR family transcriptional regulator
MALRTYQSKDGISVSRPTKGPLVKFERPVPPVRRVPLALARRFFQICTTAAAESVAEADLTPLEFAVMAYINEDVGERDIDLTSLAERIGIDRNNASLVVERLVSKSLVDRREHPEDRRVRLLRLTSRGEKLHRRLYPEASAGQQRILASLKLAERELLLDLLVRVIESNLTLARPGTGRRKRGASRSPSDQT